MSGIEKRRYARVRLPRSRGLEFLQAHVIWPNHEQGDVTDLSFKGMAVQRPGLFDVKLHEQLSLELRLGEGQGFAIAAKSVWLNIEAVGLEILDLPAVGHQNLNRFLHLQLKAQALRPVDPELISARESFSRWYQSPGLDVFFWSDPKKGIERVQMDYEGRSFEWTRGGGLNGFERELSVLVQLQEREPELGEFIAGLIRGAE